MFAMFANVRAGGHAGPSRGFCLIGVGVGSREAPTGVKGCRSGCPDGREGLSQIAAAGYILRLVWLRLFGGGARSGEETMLHKTGSGSPDGREGLPQIAAAGYILRLVWLRLFGGGVRLGEETMLHKITFLWKKNLRGRIGRNLCRL